MTEKNKKSYPKGGELLLWLGWEKEKESKWLKKQVHHLVTVISEFSWFQKLFHICDKS